MPDEATIALSPRRKWAFRLLALAILPVLLGALEIALRLGGYGYPTGFFRPLKIGAEDYMVQNDDFGLRFFPKETSRKPEPIRMKAIKPQGKFRIFIFGESAALGDPEPAYGAGRYLEVLLRDRLPSADIEVVNVAFTAINSHVIAPIARDCAGQDGDAWIIYMGNNEMVGPFGAATVFGAQSPPVLVVKCLAAIQKTRVGQLFASWARKSGRSGKASSWRGMEMFLENRVPPDSRKKAKVYQNFQKNLDDILEAGLAAGAKIILNTVAVNLQDSPPFASLSNSAIPAAGRKQFDENFARAKELEMQGDFARAAACYRQAAQQDGQFAEAQFRLGSCLLQLGNTAAAAENFQLACDNDALPFRADSRINATIRQAGRRFAGRGLFLFDAAAALGTNGAAGVCGQETFYEHVHFNFNGNYRLGREWAEQVMRLLPENIARHGGDAWASQPDCERRLGLTDWNRAFVLESVLARYAQPPLSSQFNNPERVQSLREEMNALRRRTDPNTAAKATETYLEAIKHSPEDHLLYENFAKFLESTKNLRPAIAQWKRVCQLLPENYRAYYQAGRLCAVLHQLDEAEAALSKAVSLNPELAEAWFELGNARLAGGRFELALPAYEHAVRLGPANAMYCTFVGKALSKLERHTEARQRFSDALRIQPDLWQAHFALGDELALDNQFADAANEYEAVIRLKPTNAPAHLNLGIAQARMGQFDQALRQFEETLRLDPGNNPAREYFDRLQGTRSRE